MNSEAIDPSRRLVVIQRNPTSGSGKGSRQLRELIRHLRESAFRVRLFANRDRLDRYLADHEVSEQVRCLVAAGGDGTIGSLVNRHSDFPIATLPLGTENLVARHLGIKQDGRALADIIAKGQTRKFDTGDANGTMFLLMASVGVDAEVVRELTASRRGNINHVSYVRPIVKSFLGYTFPQLTVYGPDGETLGQGSHVIATNIPQYGFRMPFAPDADPHDGDVDVRIFVRSGLIATVLHAVKTRLGWKDRLSEVSRHVVSSVRIESSRASTPSQCDGDPVADCPITITMKASSMKLVVAE